jgi:large repetitive protein
VQGTATVDYQSDGTGIDGSPPAAAGEQVVGVDATVDNYAQAAFAELSGPGTLTHTGAAYTLNLGHILQGSAPVTAGLAVSNVASGPADLLSGTFQTSGSSAFSADGFGVFIGLSAGNTEDVATVTLNTANAGVFSYTVTLLSNSSNADEYLGALPNTTLTVTASVQPAPDVSSITASTGTSALHFGQTTTLMLNMSETVIVTGGAPSLTLSDGGAAGFVGGSGTSILKFSYTVGSGDSDAPALAVSGLNLNGAVIRDGSGNSVNLLSARQQ